MEFPEVIVMARQANELLKGKRVRKVYPSVSPHKFAWFTVENGAYGPMLEGRTFTDASAKGSFVDMHFEEYTLSCHEGVNIRYLEAGRPLPKKYQLAIAFAEGDMLVFSISMYGGMYVFKGNFDYKYYQISQNSLSPLSDQFDAAYFKRLRAGVPNDCSVKAFLATGQRIPGLGNGVLQDILFQAGIHPKRKMRSVTEAEYEELLYAIKAVLDDMVSRGGRDTEKDLYGNPGGYATILSRKTLSDPCQACGERLVKEAYLGGAVYYCPRCQPLQQEPQ